LDDPSVKRLAKLCVQAVAAAAMFFPALLSGFGRFPAVFTFFAHTCALVPGLPGDYLRAAYYWMTLEECSLDSRICFGTMFAHPESRVGAQVYVGAYCVLGRVRIGPHSYLASHVQVLSGRNQHPRNGAGNLVGSADGDFKTVSIGEHCWIGAGAIIMDGIGDHTTIGAGAIVTDAMPSHCVAVGNPARAIRQTG
jgi:acetyltransferase-like isoleucine patch superfamily enzyme